MTVKAIRALDRGLDVLRIIQESKAASLNDLHLATRLAKATLLRILKTLISRDLIWQRIADGAYVLSNLPLGPYRLERGDGAGIVRWSFITSNFRVRPTPEDVIAAVDELPQRGGAAGRDTP